MEIHAMRLHPRPFEMIKNGAKTVEVRLSDEKRKLMKVGDLITFTSRENSEDSFQAKIVGLDKFTSFKDSYAAYPPQAYGAESADEYEYMYKYYSKEDEAKFGVLGIRLELISQPS